jgi:hypothetical protein
VRQVLDRRCANPEAQVPCPPFGEVFGFALDVHKVTRSQ